MILIVTHRSDFTADFVVNRLNAEQIPYYRFNCEDVPHTSYVYDDPGELQFSVGGYRYFDAVWYRRTKLPALPDELNGEVRNYLLAEYDGLLQNIFHSVAARVWLSHPDAINVAENKLLQIRLAKKIGFSVPDTLVTNETSRIKQFFLRHGHDIVVKPLRCGRLQLSDTAKLFYTSRLTADDMDHIDHSDMTPCIFQQYIEKQYEIRVTVVGTQVFAAKVDSQSRSITAIDWRKEKLPFVAYEIPGQIAQYCIVLTKELHLAFGAIDLIRTPAGDYVFLEINPNGQWAWIEIDTGLPIAKSIIEYLLKPGSR